MNRLLTCILAAFLALSACSQSKERSASGVPVPKEIIELGTLITEETPAQFWGTRLLRDLNFTDPNSFRILHWKFGPVSGSNAYYTLFNHGGPHVDAPSHIGIGQSIDRFPIDAFAGPLKVFDFSHLEIGRTISIDMLAEEEIMVGDVVLVYTGYQAPSFDSDWPQAIALTYEAAEYLANIPVRAFGTDAFNVESLTDQSPVIADSEIAQTLPAHFAFLSRGILLYEQLVNVEGLLGKENMYFVGVPLNIKDSDGMIVRPVVLVY